MCFHPHIFDRLDYPHEETINPILQVIAQGGSVNKRIGKLLDKFRNSLLFHPDTIMERWNDEEKKNLHFIFLTKFVAIQRMHEPTGEIVEDGGPSVAPEPFNTVFVRSIFCKCFEHTPKIQKIIINTIVKTDGEGNMTRTTKLFGCPWYVLVVMAWVMGTAFNGRVMDFVFRYEMMLLKEVPDSMTSEEIKELRFGALLYHLSISDLFYQGQCGQIVAEVIDPAYCVEIPESISPKAIAEAMWKVLGFQCTSDRGWDQATDTPHSSFEVLTTYKRRIISNDCHGAFEDFLGYIHDLTGPRGFMDRDAHETEVKMKWTDQFIFRRPGFFPLWNTHAMQVVAPLTALLDFAKIPLSLPLRNDVSTSEDRHLLTPTAVAPVPVSGVPRIVAISMAAALEAAWTAEEPAFDSVAAAAAASATVSSSSDMSSDFMASPETPSYSPTPWTDDDSAPSPGSSFGSFSFHTQQGTSMEIEALDHEYDSEDIGMSDMPDLLNEPEE